MTKIIVNPKLGQSELRAILTKAGDYFWLASDGTHRQFVERFGIDGLRIGVDRERVRINLDAIAMPENYPWVYRNVVPADHVEREKIVEAAVRNWPSIIRLCGRNHRMVWYA